MNANDRYRYMRGIQLLLQSGCLITPDTKWLDLGCHQGYFCRLLIDHFCIRPVGSDVWEPQLKSANDSGWDYFQADFETGLPPCESVSVISALEVIEHIVDTDSFIQRIHGKLTPGGWVLISTPNINSLRNRIMVPFGVYPVGLEYRNIIHHVRLYNLMMLTQQLREHGFRNIKMGGVAFLPLSLPFGRGAVSRLLAELLPSLSSNLLVAAQR